MDDIGTKEEMNRHKKEKVYEDKEGKEKEEVKKGCFL